MTERSSAEAHPHHHADVSGGWLRAAVFGAMDGLVSNIALIAGVGGANLAGRTVLLTGLAGLVAGAISMALGEYTSVRTQGEQRTAAALASWQAGQGTLLAVLDARRIALENRLKRLELEADAARHRVNLLYFAGAQP